MRKRIGPLVLCRYGIEYVEDATSRKRIPTVNRAQFTSIFADENYKSALQYADPYQRAVYEEEAKAIDEIQKGMSFTLPRFAAANSTLEFYLVKNLIRIQEQKTPQLWRNNSLPAIEK